MPFSKLFLISSVKRVAIAFAIILPLMAISQEEKNPLKNKFKHRLNFSPFKTIVKNDDKMTT